MTQISDPQNPDVVKKNLENSDPFFQGGVYKGFFFIQGYPLMDFPSKHIDFASKSIVSGGKALMVSEDKVLQQICSKIDVF